MVTGIPDNIWIVYQSIAKGGKRLVRIYYADLYQRICKESSEFHPVSDKWVSAPTKEELVMLMDMKSPGTPKLSITGKQESMFEYQSCSIERNVMFRNIILESEIERNCEFCRLDYQGNYNVKS